MSLDPTKQEVVYLANGVGNIHYKVEDGWYEIVGVSAYDSPKQLYSFFKDLALHFKALDKEDDEF